MDIAAVISSQQRIHWSLKVPCWVPFWAIWKQNGAIKTQPPEIDNQEKQFEEHKHCNIHKVYRFSF